MTCTESMTSRYETEKISNILIGFAIAALSLVHVARLDETRHQIKDTISIILRTEILQQQPEISLVLRDEAHGWTLQRLPI